MSLVAENHFTAFIYRPGSSVIEYGDSMHHRPPEDIVAVLQWVFSGLSETTISTISHGNIPKQGPGCGEGSCGIIAHNFIEIALGTHRTHCNADKVQRWSGSQSRHFRDTALQDLILFHHTASQSAGDFATWTLPVVPDTSMHGVEVEVNTSMGSGFNDFNNFTPNVSIFLINLQLSFLPKFTIE
ncbi:hypothetical protein GALMADRAFT_73963 [Galerina marginata CBS 339.88]|uniref:Uncharacterized protein n=1 Tax=Galerina marginata (strain CBS 339.88) TaxID=685588 RepID=A0A067SZU5_GALM3|nr:hypothetical protein GALMADRAFT_73963 [Galerina marginata CBS 339.88]